jgi:hypothetical protein
MKTKTINIYEYEELNEKAKNKVLDYFREHNQMDFMSDSLTDSLKEKLKENKIKFGDDLKLYYSLSSGQGDGVVFIGSFEWKKYNITIHSGRYYHSNSKTINITNEKGNEIENKKVYNDFEKVFQNICNIIEKEGYNYMDWENSEENIKDNIEANGYTFRENGQIENL